MEKVHAAAANSWRKVAFEANIDEIVFFLPLPHPPQRGVHSLQTRSVFYHSHHIAARLHAASINAVSEATSFAAASTEFCHFLCIDAVLFYM